MKKITDGRPEVLPPEEDELAWQETTPGSEGKSYVLMKHYKELMEKFRTINYEYTRLSEVWMGFCARERPTKREIDVAEEVGNILWGLARNFAKGYVKTSRWSKLKFWLATRLLR